MRPTLHLLNLPHTQTTPQYLSCAYTQKVVKFCKMMGGHYPIVLYAGEHNEATGIKEHVVCVTEEERRGWFGEGFNTVTSPFKWDSNEAYWLRFASRAIPALRERVKQKDLLLLTTSAQLPIAAAVPLAHPIEWAVGYEGIAASSCAFESYAWMHHVYGIRKMVNGRAFDTVIPNFFDEDDFLPAREDPEPFLLYLGRVTKRKGLVEAGLVAARLGMRLKVAGPGGSQSKVGEEILGDGCVIPAMEGLEYVGEVGKQDRASLLQRAACLLAPTLYIEPFGGVAVEAMMSGCPVVASDWGAFTEIVTPGVGRRFRTLQQGADAVKEAMTLDRASVARLSRARFSLEAVAPQFQRWFEQIGTLWGQGWHT